MISKLPADRWNLTTAAHLLNRAGFGGTPREIESLHKLGIEKAVETLVGYQKIPDPTPAPEWAKPDPDRFKKLREARSASTEKKQELRKVEQKRQREQVEELRFWWLKRMAFGPRPLQEKLTLFWHGHFATSVQKVKSAYLMWRQNEIFRQYGAGDWHSLLTEVSKDPAMLLWLDQAQSRKEHPNENFAREVMELFTLGEGHYTEKDITEAARALTGWSYNRLNQEFLERSLWHDEGEKTVLGKTGTFDGDDVLKIIVAQPQAGRFIARKLWTFFAAGDPSDALVNDLATVFRENGNEFKPLLRAMFLSKAFYDAEVMRQQIKSPVQWLVQSVRLLERDLPQPRICINMLRTLGQDLLMPPNVKGWDGGLSWITTNNLINRYNFATFLVLGENPLNPDNSRGRPKGRRRAPGRARPIDAEKLFPEPMRLDAETVLAELQRRFIEGELRPEHQRTLRSYLKSQGELDETDLLHAIRLVMSTPEFQLT